MAMAPIATTMVIHTPESGPMINPLVMECINLLTDPSMMASSRRVSFKAKVNSSIKREMMMIFVSMWGIGSNLSHMGKARLNIKMEIIMKDHLIRDREVGLEYTCLIDISSMRENGRITVLMVTESCIGMDNCSFRGSFKMD